MKRITFVLSIISLALLVSCSKNALGEDAIPELNPEITVDELAVDTLLLPPPESIIVEDIVVN